MRKPFTVAWLFVLMTGLLMGCGNAAKDEAAQSAPAVGATNGGSNPEGQQIQFMAVCTDTLTHGGQEYVLTKWLDSKDKARIYGAEHERKNKSHVVKYKERTKP